jgi:hypothetical protein
MGFFSSTKVTVAANTQPIIASTPNIPAQSVMTAINKNRDIGTDLVGAYANGIAINMFQYRRYGLTNYYLGLPQGSSELVMTTEYKVAAIIEAEVGQPVTVVSNVLEVSEPKYFAYPYMQANYAWDSLTNVMTNPPPYTGPSASNPVIVTAIFLDAVATENTKLTIELRGTTTAGREYDYFVDVIIPGMVVNEYYYHTVYVLTNAATAARYFWNYRISSNVHPELKPPTGHDLNSPYFPVVPIRENNVDKTNDDGSAEFNQRKRILSIIDIDIANIGEAIKGTPAEPNEDIANLDHSYIHIGVNLQDSSQTVIRYLHDYFTYLGAVSPGLKDSYDKYFSGPNSDNKKSPPPMEKIIIKDNYFHVEICFSYAETTIVTGNIGIINFATRTNIVKPKLRLGDYGSMELSEVIFRKQLTPTTYEETKVVGLMHINYVYKKHTVDTTVEESLVAGNGNFIVPVNISVANSLGMVVANELYYSSIQITFLVYDERKLKWYETGFGQLLIIIVAVAINIYAFGTGSSLTSAILGAGVADSIPLAALIIVDVILSYVIQAGFILLAEYIPPELAFALAAIAGVYAATSLGITTTLPYATEALNIAVGISGASVDLEQKKIAEELEQNTLDYTKNMQSVEDMEQELLGPVQISALDVLNLYTDIGVPVNYIIPDSFYYQAVHNKNPGRETIEAVHNYTENSLSLPTLAHDLNIVINI